MTVLFFLRHLILPNILVDESINTHTHNHLTSCCRNIITLKLHHRNLIQYVPHGKSKVNLRNHRQKEKTQPQTSPAKNWQKNKANDQTKQNKTTIKTTKQYMF